jgi:hypothetical protein
MSIHFQLALGAFKDMPLLGLHNILSNILLIKLPLTLLCAIGFFLS